ncbi:MAG: cell wall-binding protein [Methylococcaceae bacterium]
MATKKPVLSVVGEAKTPNKKDSTHGGGGSGGGSDKNKEHRFDNYLIKNGSFYQIKKTRDDIEYEIRLSDFTCQIKEEIITDDGLNDASFLRIEGKRWDGRALPLVDVPSKSFFSGQGGNWVNESWGCSVRVMVGNTIPAQLRNCIHVISQQEGDIPHSKVYKFTGWKKLNDQWHYLTGSGAITTEGLVNTVQVDIGAGHMGKYQLPEPLSGDALKLAVSDTLALLAVCPAKPHIGAALLAAVARAPLGECHPTDFALWIHGLTGSKKSSIAAIAQAFYGNFNARSFPSNWEDSSIDCELKLHQTKESIIVIDDFKPTVSRKHADKIYAMAEKIVRAIGNQSGSGRRKPTHEAKPSPFPRSMVIITAEELCKGQSLLGRLLVLELTRADVHNATLTRLQDAANAGNFTGVMSAYLQWLAPRIDQFKKDLPRLVEQCRNAAMMEGIAPSHPRAPEIYANLVVGFRTFIDFLYDAKTIDNEQAETLCNNAENALKQAFSEQSDYLAEQDDAERFLQLLRASFSSGNAHIACRLNQSPPSIRPFVWCWRDSGTDQAGDTILKPMGDLVGWYYEAPDKPAEIWLQQDTAFKVVQQFARLQGDSFLLSPSSLWRRLYDKGVILKTERNPKSNTPLLTVKRMIAGRSIRVMILHADLIESGE